MGEAASGDGLAPIVARLDGPPQVVAFARAVLRRVAPAGLARSDPGRTATALVDAFAFADGRTGDIEVRVVDPPVTLDGDVPLGSVVEVSCDDRPYLATTLREELLRLGHRVVDVVHPVYGARRDERGRLAEIGPARPARRRECFLQVELAETVPPDARADLERRLTQVLADVLAVTGDGPAMRAELEGAIGRLRASGPRRFRGADVDEAVALLRWLLDGNFDLLGARAIDRPGTALGLLAHPAPLPPDGAPGPAAAEPDDPAPAGPVTIGSTSELSALDGSRKVHLVDVAETGPTGEPAGRSRFAGVFSRKASTEPATITPLLRQKLRRILELEDLADGSEAAATLASLFQVLPKEMLFGTDVPALREVLAGMVAAEDQHGVQARLHLEPATGTVSALLSVPHERYSPALRQRIEQFLASQLDSRRVESHVSLGEWADAVLRFVVHVEGPLPAPPLEALERELRLLCRTWDQELAGALTERVGDHAGRRMARAWGEWFPPAYRGAVPAAHAVDDVLNLERMVAGAGEPSVVLAPDPAGRAHARLKVYSAGAAVELSRFLPIVESLGLWAIEERVSALGPAGRRVHLHDFAVTDPVGGRIELERDGPRLAAAATALWHGRAEVDSLNRLVLRAGLAWDDVALLRSYHRYRNQVAVPSSTAYVAEVLVGHAAVARSLVELFAARFDPRRGTEPGEMPGLRDRLEGAFDAVSRLDHDRILRGFAALVEATLRTNRYSSGGTHLALKLDSAAVPGMPVPVPHREIFVYGPVVEGVHLRWGPVARGGVRRSERPDDYRSEVLGLLRAQVLKNALIVPTGAKGGFVVKRRRDGAAAAADVREAYEIFVRCLLELTDNVVGGRVVPVANRRDGDDPYLVVAADSGTAGLSDLANRVSQARSFWLGDAFASGGSSGYDHKALGITARGAWVAVRHHLAELGVDPDHEPVTVAGIGDLSGDVFGNFMVQSDRIRLVAAFDHRDIFVDPDPDPARSHRERTRLAALPRSSWQDYDRSAISAGGGVWSRHDKAVPLSPEARAVLGIEEAVLAPPDLIRAILTAPVGILFAGGIGTFVRAGSEPDRDVGDRANAEVRVEGSAIRARIVAEGANLAFTQRARVEFARRGGRINTDAIDNAAGVDISDREVNLKILLGPAVEAGEITSGERDRLLTEVCDDVVGSVLADCARQSLAISRAQAAAPALAEANEALMRELEEAAVLDRAVEVLPSTAEMQARAGAGAGLTRPELAVLLAGAKRSLAAALLASGLPDQPALHDRLAAYFPPVLAERFGHLVSTHRLRRELVASRMANHIVDRMGPTFVSRLAGETGATPDRVASAYWIARQVSGSPRHWAELDRGVEAQVEAAATLSGLLESLTRAYLRRGEGDDVAGCVERDRPAFAAVEPAVFDLVPAQQRRRLTRLAEALVDSGLDAASAPRWAALSALEPLPGIAALARDTGREVTDVARAVLLLSEALGIDRLLGRLAAAAPAGRWERAAVRGLADDLHDLRLDAARRAVAGHSDLPAAGAARRLLADRSERLGTAGALLRDLGTDPGAGLDGLTVAARAIRRALDP